MVTTIESRNFRDNSMTPDPSVLGFIAAGQIGCQWPVDVAIVGQPFGLIKQKILLR
jgi:hypothetical protein